MDTYSLLALFSQCIVWLEGDFFLSEFVSCDVRGCVFFSILSFFLSFLKHTEPLLGAPNRRHEKGVSSVSAPIGSIILANSMLPTQAEITQKHISVNGQQNCRYRPLSAWARRLTVTIGTQFIRSLVEPLQTQDQNKHLADWLFRSRRAKRAESGPPPDTGGCYSVISHKLNTFRTYDTFPAMCMRACFLGVTTMPTSLVLTSDDPRILTSEVEMVENS